MATRQVREDENGQKFLSAPLTGLSSTIATSELPGAVQPDGVTTKVDSAGILSAIGGNLLLNSEERITESGTWTVKVTGWHYIWMIDGGESGSYGYFYPNGTRTGQGGRSGKFYEGFIFLTAGQEVPVVIGAGGHPTTPTATGANVATGRAPGGKTSFGELTPTDENRIWGGSDCLTGNGGGTIFGGGPGGGPDLNKSSAPDAEYYGAPGYGAGGSAFIELDNTKPQKAGNGGQGIVILRWHDPAKAAGPSE